MRWIAGALCAVILGVQSLFAQEFPAPRKDDIVRLLGEFQDVAPIRQELQALGFRDENLDLAVEQTKRLYRDPDVAGYVAEQLLDLYRGELSSATQAGGLIGPLVGRGLGHVSTRELHYYYRIEQVVLHDLPSRDCGLLLRGRLDGERYYRATSAAAAKLSPKALEEYYRIEFKAAKLGAKRRPVKLSQAEEKRISGLVQAEVLRRIEARKDANALKRVLKSPRQATLRQTCTVGKLFMASILEMTGDDQRKALIYLGS